MNRREMLLAEVFGRGMLDKRNRFQKIELNHVPIMITDNQKILCLPTREETFHVGVTAATSKGKGIAMNTMLGFEYWHTKKLCMILNDFQNETFEESLPCLNKMFLQNQRIINVSPTGYPIVYVYPSNKDLEIDETEKLFPHIKMSIPIRVLISEIENYYKLDKAAKYVTGYKERFMQCSTLDEIEQTIGDILEENISSDGKKKKEGYENMKFKIKTIFKNIFDEEISDNIHTDAPAFLNVMKDGKVVYNNLTVQSLIAARLIPSIQTSVIRGKSWFAAYMSFIVESLYDDFLFRDEEFLKGKHLSMYVPEIDKMWKKGDGHDLIRKSLNLIGTNGRRAGIGLRWDAQDYDAVPDLIRANTRHLFVLRKSDAEEVRGIKSDFNMGKQVQDWILGLETEPEKGKFECVALTNDKFVLYNLRDGSVENSSEPHKGRLITPLAQHKNPGVSLKNIVKRVKHGEF